MDSRVFIKTANALVARIEAIGDSAEDKAAVQKEVTQLFAAMQNPSLSAAYKLRDAALAADLQVAPKVLAEISRFD